MQQKNLVLLSYNYTPDLSAGSFRSKALVDQLCKDLGSDDKLFVITTKPNRYDSYRTKTESLSQDENVDLHRINVPQHANRWLIQIWGFSIFFFKSFFILRKIKPDFIICTTDIKIIPLTVFSI